MTVLAVNSYLQSTEVQWDGYNLRLNYANEKKRDWKNMAFKNAGKYIGRSRLAASTVLIHLQSWEVSSPGNLQLLTYPDIT